MYNLNIKIKEKDKEKDKKNDKEKVDSEKINLINELCKAIKNINGYYPEVIISARLCVIKFKYGANNIDFDISIMGFCPYLHSILFRTYSLIEPRFSLLAITLKKFIEIINIKNRENRNGFLNSFSWMILLITFLQDVIQPQVLPKILSDEKKPSKCFKIIYILILNYYLIKERYTASE